MCLNSLKEKIPKNIKYGYKVVWKHDNVLTPIFYNNMGIISTDITFKINQWKNDNNKDINIYNDNFLYKSGFHCFTNKKDAIKYKNYLYYNSITNYKDTRIYKIEMDDIITYGIQKIGLYSANTIVCKKIKLLEEI